MCCAGVHPPAHVPNTRAAECICTPFVCADHSEACFADLAQEVLVVVHVCAGSSAGTRYKSSAVVVCRGGGGKRKTSARTARRTRQSHSTGRDSARGDGGLARMHARTRSQDGGVRTGHTGTTDGHTDTRTGHVVRSLLGHGQLLSSHGDLSLSDRHSGHDPPCLRARRRSARHRYLLGCKVQHLPYLKGLDWADYWELYCRARHTQI